jgi:hypothetical protein
LLLSQIQLVVPLQHGVEAAARIDAAVGDAAARAKSLADDIAASAAAGGGAHSQTSDAAHQLATQLEAFAKHPNPKWGAEQVDWSRPMALKAPGHNP